MLKSLAYKGRHRAPSATGRTASRVVAAAVVAVSPLVMAGTSQAGTLDAIEQCESSGNPHASNGTHFGSFQFDLRTWRSVGGTGNPGDASPAEQRKRAEMLMASRGTQPWDASKSCWSGKAGGAKHAAPAKVRAAVAKPKPAPTAKHRTVPAPTTGAYVVKPGDTLTELVGAHWRQVCADNQLPDCDLILVGEHLDLRG